MTAYIAFAAEFVARYTLDRSAREKDVALPRGTLDKPIKQMLFAMFTIAILLYIRSIYRIVTLSEGYGSTIVSTEWIFGSSACPPLCSDTEILIVTQLYLMVVWSLWRCLHSIGSTLACCWLDRTNSWRTSRRCTARRFRSYRQLNFQLLHVCPLCIT